MRLIKFAAIVITFSQLAGSLVFAAGVWTPLTNQIPTGSGGITMLLSDGSILVSASNGIFGPSFGWSRLHPDSAGNYINGTWTLAADSNVARYSFPANVLPSGKVFVMGGEYSSEGSITNSGEIYDPVANTWTTIATFPQPEFGDDPTILLPSGKILCGYIFSAATYLYDPVANTWTPTGTKLRQDRSDEETWALLPDGSVLSYDIFASPATGAGTAQRYVPSTGRWVTTGPVPIPLTNQINDGLPGGLGAELGPMMLLPDGRIFLIGANNSTVFYTPSTDTWTTGPTLPTNLGCDDAPAAMLPNGHVLFLADNSLPIDFTPPTHVFDFDPVANTITDVTPTGPLASIFATQIAQQFCLLVLPNGHVLLTTGNSVAWDYTPTGAPNPAWAPKITSVTKKTTTSYTLSGTQLNGISEGSCFGDDLENSTNYPIVKMTTETGAIKYARTTNWAPGIVASGSRQTSVDFDLPTGTLNGVYQLSVIANGISSPNQQFVIGPPPVVSNVTAVYNSGTKTLTLTGDNNANSLTVSLAAGVLEVQGANGTKINNGPSFSTAVTGQIVLVSNLNDGDDAISVVGVNSSTTTVTMGSGNDKAAFTLCNIGTLTIDGGAGVDVVLITSSTVKTLHETNIP